ncbi:MAG: hypothetical protein LBC74_08745 [Planctomycetaceae bacterium]|jgi:hypothetical protein|nr:hypothetical protein [Planctomycetaceae bacterium]
MKIFRLLFIVTIILPQFLFAQDNTPKPKKSAIRSYREMITQPPPKDESQKIILHQYYKITISPQKFTVPLLKHRINVFPLETKYDNAYPFYVEAKLKFNEIKFNQLQTVWKSDPYRLLDSTKDADKCTQLEFNRFPLYSHYSSKQNLIPVDGVDEERIYHKLDDVYKFLEKGSKSRLYNWSESAELKGIATLLSFVQEMRELARYLSDKADWEIRNGKFDDAIKTIKTGLALGNHVKNSIPYNTFVEMLVGIAINGVMYKQLFHLISQPDAPNLYPALTQYQPNTNVISVINSERSFWLLNSNFNPEILDNIDKASNEVCKNVLEEIALVLAYNTNGTSDDLYDKKAPKVSQIVSVFCVLLYQPAKQHLRDSGLSDEKIESLSLYQIVVPYLIKRVQHFYDLMCIEATFELGKSYSAFRSNETDIVDTLDYINPVDLFLRLVLPPTYAAQCAVLRESQTIDRLKIIEAIRYYAAVNNGKLPESLDAITEVPVPKICPLTGRHYNYKLEGKTITIDYNIMNHPKSSTSIDNNARMQIVLE